METVARRGRATGATEATGAPGATTRGVALTPASSLPRHVEVMSRGWGGFMIAMAGVNAWLAATGRAGDYRRFAEASRLPWYRRAFDAVLRHHPLPWVMGLVAFEAATGAATLAPGRTRLVGLGASTAFVLALTPANPATYANPLIAAVPGYLLARHLRARCTGPSSA